MTWFAALRRSGVDNGMLLCQWGFEGKENGIQP
jgi:hypothetical protein